MAKLKGITVTLISKVETGTDDFNKVTYDYIEKEVQNVLVSPTKSDEILSSQNLTGRTAVYTLAIPKGDTNDWENNEVRFFGETWRVFGTPLQGIETMIPLDWNKKVAVERYE